MGTIGEQVAMGGSLPGSGEGAFKDSSSSSRRRGGGGSSRKTIEPIKPKPKPSSGLSESQLRRARSLTEAAQIKEFGRVVTSQPKETRIVKLERTDKRFDLSPRIKPTPSSSLAPSTIQTIKPKEQPKQSLFKQFLGFSIPKGVSQVTTSLERASKTSKALESRGIEQGFRGRTLGALSSASQRVEKVSTKIEQTGKRKATALTLPVKALSQAATKTTGEVLVTTGLVASAAFAPATTGFVGRSAAKGAAIPEVAKQITKVTASQEEKAIIKQEGFRDIIKRANQAQQAALNQQGFKFPGTEAKLSLRGIAGQLPIVPLFLGKEVFAASTREQFEAKGLTGKELETAVSAAKRFQTGAQIGEGVALLEISRGAEAFGRKQVSTAFEKQAAKGVTIPTQRSFGKVFKITAPQIAKAGIGEGIGAELAQQTARQEDFKAKNLLIAGALGGITAGGLGGTIAGLAPARPKTSGAISIIANIADPLEKPADIAQDITEKVVFKLTGKAAPKTFLTKVIPETDILAFTPSLTPSLTPSKAPKPKAKPKADKSFLTFGQPILTPSLTPTPTPTKTKIVVPSLEGILQPDKPFENPYKFPENFLDPKPTIPIDKPKKPDDRIPILPDPFTPAIPTPAKTPSNIFQVKIPTMTPIFRVPPPLPLGFPNLGAGAGGATRIRKRKKTIDELALGKKLIGDLLGRR